MLLCCEGKCMFSLQRFMPHNYSMNLNLAFIPTLDLFALKSLVVKKKSFVFLIYCIKNASMIKKIPQNLFLLYIKVAGCVTTPVLKQCGAEHSLAQPPPVSQFQIAASLGLGKETHGYI